MDYFYLVAAVIALGFGVWIATSGVRRWRERHKPSTAEIRANTSPVTNFRWRPQLETLAGTLIIMWALRLLIMYALQLFRAQPVSM